MKIVHYTQCPICNCLDISPLLTVKDHTVSKKQYVIWLCKNCSLRFTQDVPDEDSISPYYQSEQYISHTNTDNGLINRLYKKVRNYTLKIKSDLVISETKPFGKILDLGAGIGAFLSVIKERGWNVTGIEPDAGARDQAKSLFGINLLDKEAFPNLLPSSFDAITLWHVLEHVHDLHIYLNQLKQLLKKDGKIFIAVPNYNSLDSEIYGSFWAAYDVPRHLYHFNTKSMNLLLQANGLEIISKKPMWFDSYYISLLSSKYKYGNTKWFSSILNGFRSSINTFFNVGKSSSIIYIVVKK